MKDYSISFIRLYSTIFIISCHILQQLNHELAWWLNVGVQIFFVTSGYLYGLKHDGYFKWQWLKKSFIKLLTDYYIYVLIIIMVYAIFSIEFLSINVFANLLLLQNHIGDIPGIEHLWFIPYILVCYLFTPALNSLHLAIREYNELTYWLIIFMSLFYLQLLEIVGAIDISIAWLSCYIIGFYISKRYMNQKNKSDRLNIQRITLIMLPICLISIGIRIYFEYITDLTFGGVISSALSLFVLYSRSLMGITLFFCSLLILNKFSFQNVRLRKTLDWSDKYSYDIYIVHQIYILGAYSIIGRTPHLGFDIVLIIVLIVSSAIILRYVSSLAAMGMSKWNLYKEAFSNN